MTSSNLAGKKIVVIGGTAGIGLATAIQSRGPEYGRQDAPPPTSTPPERLQTAASKCARQTLMTPPRWKHSSRKSAKLIIWCLPQSVVIAH